MAKQAKSEKKHKKCPKCGSIHVIVFDADNDICQKCRHWFPGS